MDDIQLALGASPEVGRLYKDAKAFSIATPVLALSFLRGLAVAFCNCLDHDLTAQTLDDKISSLDRQGMLKPILKRQLRILQTNGNKAAHPENYDFVDLNFPVLATEALVAARGLIEHLYIARHEGVPAYEVAEVESGALKEMCFRAMLDRDVNAMNQAGEYFKERADQLSKIGAIRSDGYPLAAREDIDQAMFWFKQGASREQPNCLYQYGHYLTQHLNVGPEQVNEGERYIAQAAQADHSDALVYVAQGALEGRASFARDEVYALELFERAAGLGHPAALSQLGAMYATGVGCEASPVTAALFTLQAARAGIPQAQYNLFVLYMNGTGLMRIESEAIKWLVEAAAQDYPNAVYNLACFIQIGKVPGRPASDAEAEFERAMAFDKFRARAALSAAEMIYDRGPNLPDLLRAGKHLQTCFALISTEGDSTNLRDECLLACTKVVRSLREHINVNGPDHSLQGDDIMTSALFDRNFVPFVDREARWTEVTNVLFDAGVAAIEQNTAYLLREACLDPRPTRPAPQGRQRIAALPSGPNTPKLGRNDLCHCGSGLKFKKCHGRGT